MTCVVAFIMKLRGD